VRSLSAVECERLSRWYGDVIALNDLSASIGKGVTGLLGPNGSGKSTFMSLCVGLLRPSAGRIEVLGEDPWDNPGLLRRIGYVPEAPAPWRHLTGRDALVRGARLTGLDRNDAGRAATEGLRRVGLAEAGDKLVGAYSHGMQQRLKFALATLHRPELLILDEPLLGTDPLARRDLLHLIQDMADDGTSILLSTHVLPDVEALTERILLLHHGRLMAHGEVHEIRDLLDQHPRTVRVATADPRRLGAELWSWDEVLSVEADEDAVTVRTRNAAAFYARLQDHLIERPGFTSVTSPDDNVEAVFEYLVR